MERLPVSKQWIYAMGLLGWSLHISIYMVVLVYYYDPPSGRGLPQLVPSLMIGPISIFALVMAVGRLFDGVTDPIIAQWSDKSKNPIGRRIPFMRWAVIPTVLFSMLMYLPWTSSASNANLVWLMFTQVAFFIGMTAYNVPYNALLPELGHTSQLKLRLAVYQGGALLVGLILGASLLVLAPYFQHILNLESKFLAYRYAIWFYCIIGGIFLALPAWTIDEKKYCIAKPASIPLKQAVKEAFSNRHFKFFLAADFLYWTAMAIINTSLIYYVVVLLGPNFKQQIWIDDNEMFGSVIMGLMVIGAIITLFGLQKMARKTGKKLLINFSFLTLAALLLLCFFLGRFPLSGEFQGYLLAFGAMVPLAIMSTLPTALLAEISDLDAKQSGEQKEGMYFAVRNLFQKIGQTLGMVIVVLLIQLGKDVGDDLGVRLTALAGLLLCIVAAIVFSFFRERKLTHEIEALEEQILLKEEKAEA
jgi:GPH family glycoside/pentoside/hexuronide:cation symporter